MRNLFAVKHSNPKRLKEAGLHDRHFENKMEAKAARRKANGLNEDGEENLETGFYVTRGPDNFHARRS